MENTDKGITVPKWVLINWTKMPPNISKIIVQIVCLGPKIWDLMIKVSQEFWIFKHQLLQAGMFLHNIEFEQFIQVKCADFSTNVLMYIHTNNANIFT